jgi:hypothetical protein
MVQAVSPLFRFNKPEVLSSVTYRRSGMPGIDTSAVERPTADHLYWLKLQIDLTGAAIRNPAVISLLAR